MNPRRQLEACGQAPWLGYLRRGLIEKGELRTLGERDGLKGVTSNPRGSVISSWLLDLGSAALWKDPQFEGFSGFVQDSGEGLWAVEAAIEEAVPAELLNAALYARFRSRPEHTFGEKMLSAMRLAFGGHIEEQEKLDPEAKPVGPRRSAAAKHAAA